jgi:hypothetical protein
MLKKALTFEQRTNQLIEQNLGEDYVRSVEESKLAFVRTWVIIMFVLVNAKNAEESYIALKHKLIWEDLILVVDWGISLLILLIIVASYFKSIVCIKMAITLL